MRYLFYLTFITVCFVSCIGSNEQDQADPLDGITEGFEEAHPIPEKMPFSEVEAEQLAISEDFSSVTLPKPLLTLKEFLEDDNRFTTIELTFLSMNKDHFFAKSLHNNQLLLLDVRNDRLVQYDIKEGEYKKLAPTGRGPGDLLFAEEIQLFDDTLYIPMGGYRISVFDCKPDICEYARSLNTGLNNYSLTKKAGQLAVLSQPMFTGEADNEEAYYSQDQSVHFISRDGEIEQSFVPIYDHLDPAIRWRVSAEGSIRSFEEHGYYTVNFSWFPYMYLFDENMNLERKYRFPGFKQGYIDSNPHTLTSTERHNDQSYFTHTTKIDEDWLLIVKRNRENTERVRRGIEADEVYTYYGFNLSNREMYLIGKDSELPTDKQRAIHVTENGLLVNSSESMMWVKQ
jgi:hypothetical protein